MPARVFLKDVLGKQVTGMYALCLIRFTCPGPVIRTE